MGTDEIEEIEATINGKQEKALELMLRGINDNEVAKTIGVTRQTISNWRHHDTVFIDTFEEARRALREKHRDSINGLVDKAIGVLEKAMEDEDPKTRVQAAKLVLSMAGLKESMKEGNPQNDKEKFLEELAKAFGVAARDLGYTDPGGE
jgi:hypothetical protein